MTPSNFLTNTDQWLDDLISAVRSINHAKHHEILMPGDDEPRYWQRKEWIDWMLGLCDAAPAPATQVRGRYRIGRKVALTTVTIGMQVIPMAGRPTMPS